jgi:erythromycin esterase-like protein/predicted phosphoribosyltransferase
MPERFHDHRDAGRSLAGLLGAYVNRPDVIVLALPRGGVPVGYEVARALGAPLDVFLVRKLGVPGYEELAMGAIATGSVRVLNESVVDSLKIPKDVIDGVAARELRELERREHLYRGDRPAPDLHGRTAILVDDGLATGATMLAAVKALRQQHPAGIVVAVPTAALETCEALSPQVDDLICAITPEPFLAVGHWYEDFSQTTDSDVSELLAQLRESEEKQASQSPTETHLAWAIRTNAHPLTGSVQDYAPLMQLVGDARFVLLGEASHGTHEFYRARAEITKRLIAEKGFTAVAVEADWPDAYRVNRYVRGAGDDVDAVEALVDFRRFPTWMWRNADVAEFVDWLRKHNDARPRDAAKTGFYGLDLYSLHASMKAVLQYLEKVDPEAAQRARERYACFEDVGPDPQAYGFMAHADIDKSCQDQVISQLVELQQRRAQEAVKGKPLMAEEDLFDAEQNARAVKDAEAYYRSMFLAEESSWNLRDRHMAETLDLLAARPGGNGKVVVWAHNSHVGDARATEMRRRGELNIGQLARERYGRDAVLVGFTTHHGTVTAASNWGAPAERKRVRAALAGSHEAIFHTTRLERFLLTWRDGDAVTEGLREPKLERAIGVIYRPETERISHYFHARLPEQFDAVLHFDATHAVEPLEYTAEWEAGELPETFPFAV